jgi:hypothetical protein
VRPGDLDLLLQVGVALVAALGAHPR